ncbi:hypothetical protein [Mangrovimonas sp. ST2L15]|uniref:hypothetical protein n=1 Tax=Mangrovimonas sp. ST2L15 TaxID=1645916 RepID=UPI000A4EC7A1|nr:hypothetical protein [Mangrovimonas sp. ST2L15]
MKTINRFLMAMAVMLFFATNTSQAQEENTRPKFISVTTMHWNMGMDPDDFSMDEWKAVEKEYVDKVIKNNEYVIGVSYYTHYITPSNTEILFVKTYPSWEAIEKSFEREQELAKAAWGSEAAIEKFFKKRNNYYMLEHSDEIYVPIDGAKLMDGAPSDGMILYVRKNKLSNYLDGTEKEFMEGHMLHANNIVNKNEFVKAYYPHMHAWGADKSEFIEAYFISSMADYEKMFERNEALAKEKWSESERESMGKKYGKYFTGEHGDYIYKYVGGITN